MTSTASLKKAALIVAVIFAFAAPSLALDAKVIRDISRADTSAKLAKLADSITKDAGTRQAKDFEEGTQIAAETSTYLLYIVARQNALMLDSAMEQEQTEE